MEDELLNLVLHLRPVLGSHGLHQGRQVRRTQDQVKPDGLDAGDVEQVVNDDQQTMPDALHGRKVLALVVEQGAEVLIEEHLDVPQDRAEGCAQFMRRD